MSAPVIRFFCLAIAIFSFAIFALTVVFEIYPKGFVFDHSMRFAIAVLLVAAYFIHAFIKAGRKSASSDNRSNASNARPEPKWYDPGT